MFYVATCKTIYKDKTLIFPTEPGLLNFQKFTQQGKPVFNNTEIAKSRASVKTLVVRTNFNGLLVGKGGVDINNIGTK